MKHLKRFSKVNESLDINSINWNDDYRASWEKISEEAKRIYPKIGLSTSYSGRPTDHTLEWKDKTLCLKKDFWSNWISKLQDCEKFYDEFLSFIHEFQDDAEGHQEVRFICKSFRPESKWMITYKVPQKLSTETKMGTIHQVEHQRTEVVSQDLISLSNLIQTLERAFKSFGITNVTYKLNERGTGMGYGEITACINFITE